MPGVAPRQDPPWLRIQRTGEVPFKHLNLYYYFPPRPRAVAPELDPEQRRSSFREVVAGLSVASALEELSRCFHCGTCVSCDLCLVFCPDMSVARGEGGTGYRIRYEYCKGCGACAEECPRGAVVMETEEQMP